MFLPWIREQLKYAWFAEKKESFFLDPDRAQFPPFFFLAGTAGGEGAETEDRVQTEQGAVAREQDEARAWSVLASIWLNSTGPRDFEKKPCTERLHIIYLCKSREKCAQAGVGVGTGSP